MRFTKTLRTFHIIFLCMFGWIVLQVFLSNLENNFLCALWGVALIVIAAIVYKWLSRRFDNADYKKANRVFWICMGIMFVLQLLAGYFLMYEPGTDLRAIHEISKTAAMSGSFENIYQNVPNNAGYLARYTNNHGIFLLLTGYYRILFLLFGEIPLYASVFINTLAIGISVLFVYKTASKLFPPAGALTAFLLCFLFLPYYTYTPFFYTDSLSMPFVILPLFFYISALKAQERKKRYGFLVVAALLIYIGYALKGSVIILLVGAVVFLFLSRPVKQALACSCTMAAIFLACTIIFSAVVNTTGFVTKEELQKEQYPLTHWIMMGLNGKGGYTHSDSLFTRKAGDYTQKKEATVAEIGHRLEQYGASGLFAHLTEKGTWTWSDGTYYISNHIAHNPLHKNILHEFFLQDGSYYFIFLFASNAYQLMLLLLICLSIAKSIKKPMLDFTVLLKGLIFGVFLFFLIWETRSRYLFNFTPVFILVATDGILALSKIKLSSLRAFYNKRIKKHT